MKKAISSFLIIILLFVPIVSVFGQKRSLRTIFRPAQKAKVSEVSRSKAVNVFESVKAYMSNDRVLIEWQMQVEKANIGFYVHRVDAGGDQIINSEIVFGSAATGGRQPQAGTDYKFLDYFGGINSTYYIESVDLDGNRVTSGIANTLATRGKGDVAGVPSNSNEPSNAEGLSLRSEKLALTKEILLQRSTESNDPDPATHAWVISHPGARIDVKTEGIYRVPFAQLQSAGFDINSDKARWQLYRAGLEQAFSLNEAGSYIEFYGKGVDTPETDIQGYFLIVGDIAGKRIENSVARPSNSTVALSNYKQTFTFKERFNYLNSILNGPPENYWGRTINATTGANISFDLTGIDFSSPSTTLTVDVQGFSPGLHNLRITLNGQVLEPIIGVSQFPFSGEQTIQTSLLKDAGLGQGTNVLNLLSTGSSGDFNLFDNFELAFARKHVAQQGVLKAYTVNNKKTLLSGFESADVTLFDITHENEPRRITNLNFQNQGGSFTAELGAARGRVLFGVDNSKIKSPFAVVNNDGQVLSSTQLGADLIIIAYKDFMTQAQTWANYRISQGFSVKVVNVDEVYNEFNFGNLSSDSIEAFLNYAYHNWSHTPQYVLLLGDSSFDSRNYQGVGFFNYVPTRIVTTVFSETGSDDSLVDFDDDGLSEMAIGRIPARTSSAIDIAYQKTVNWESNLNDPLSRGALMAADVYDATNDIDFLAISDRIKDELPASMPKTTILRSQPNAPADLLTQMNTGKYIANYTGHGSLGTWNNTAFFWNGTVPSMTNHNNETLFTMLTCLNGYFLSLNGTSLAETLLAFDNGGAVAAWASSGETTPDVQEVMGRRFFRKIGEGSIPRMGDLVKDAKSVINGGTDVRLSFVLLGDPMLKVR